MNLTITEISTPAAIYLRVSTENQNYSTQHQRAAIVTYAASHSLHIVAEYIDEGKSGLDIRRRSGLTDLMADVQSGTALFRTIVVYDVSRWGRFQDVDEAAYHEHTCRRAGIKVVYCAEQFQNDGSPLSSLLKGIKRTMAAEYSRELSEKVFAAQCRFVGMGFKQGGHAGYGFRRLSLAADGTARRLLKYGESKATVTDRVVLVLGPDHEVETTRRIYELYVDGLVKECAIARQLNSDGISSEFGRPWTKSMVNSILTNVKYTGRLVFNRRSGKLSRPRQHNDAIDWVTNDSAFPSIVSPAMFERARAERAKRNRRYGHDELLGLLRECNTRHRKITATIIAADELLPDPQLYVRAFGSLIKAYDRAGIVRTKTHNFLDTKDILFAHRDRLVTDAALLAEQAGATVAIGKTPGRFVLNDSVQVQVIVVPGWQPHRGQARWTVRKWPAVDFHIVARHQDKGGLKDYFLLPVTAFPNSGKIYLKGAEGEELSRFRYLQLQPMFPSN